MALLDNTQESSIVGSPGVVNNLGELQQPIMGSLKPRHRREDVESFQGLEQHVDIHTSVEVGSAALKGALFGPFREMEDIVGEFKQGREDYRAIRELISGARSRTRHKAGFMAMKLWYAGPLPAYQIADDALTYPLYLHTQDQFNTGTAYGIAASATIGLAAGVGYVQRYMEAKKASIMGLQTEKDTSDNVPLLLDSTVNSGPWQVVRKASEPREEGDPVKIVSKFRVAQYAGAYAVVNTGLYAAAEQLPTNEWVGFGAMLWGVWMVRGAYRSVKELELEPTSPYQNNGWQNVASRLGITRTIQEGTS